LGEQYNILGNDVKENYCKKRLFVKIAENRPFSSKVDKADSVFFCSITESNRVEIVILSSASPGVVEVAKLNLYMVAMVIGKNALFELDNSCSGAAKR
jgi:hypothetical protein